MQVHSSPTTPATAHSSPSTRGTQVIGHWQIKFQFLVAGKEQPSKYLHLFFVSKNYYTHVAEQSLLTSCIYTCSKCSCKSALSKGSGMHYNNLYENALALFQAVIGSWNIHR